MEYSALHTIIESILKKSSCSLLVYKVIAQIQQAGGRALLVGGVVRDILLGLPVKDIDIEVHGLTFQQVEDLLKQYGTVSYIGKAFGVLKVHGFDVDWSLPRRDTCGRHPAVTVDPHLSLHDAFKRRDLTMNAMGIDLVTHELIDPFDGQRDIQKRILRTPDPLFFVQDPLRFYRVMQFISRFEMEPDEQLDEVCRTMYIATVSVERIEAEFQKLFMQSTRPSLGIRWIARLGRLAEVMPELAQTIGVKQEPAWHPEGDVFEHTMQAVDAAAQLDYESFEQKMQVMYATLCHDLGKAVTTINDKGVLRSPGHAQAGVWLARSLLTRITRNKLLTEVVEKLVDNHMVPGQLVMQGSLAGAYKRLAKRLMPHATLHMLTLLMIADRRGRNAHSSLPLQESVPEAEEFLSKATEFQIDHAAEQPLLQGKDIMDLVAPGPAMGALLRRAYELQIEHGITDKEELKSMLRSDNAQKSQSS